MVALQLCSSACEGVNVNYFSPSLLDSVSLPAIVPGQTIPSNCPNDLRDALLSCLNCYSSAGQTLPDNIQTITSSLNSCDTSDPSTPPSSPKPTTSSLPLRIEARSNPDDTAIPILGAAIGGIISGLVCLGILGSVILCLCRRAQRRHSMLFTSPTTLEAAYPAEPEMESFGPKITGTNRHQRLSATPWTDPNVITLQRPRPALRRQMTGRSRDVGGMHHGHRSDSHLPLLVTGERKIRPSTSQSALSERTSYGPSRSTSVERISPTVYNMPRSASAMTFQSSSATSLVPTTPGAVVSPSTPLPMTPPPYSSPYMGPRRRAASAASLVDSHDDWSMEIGHALSMREARRKGTLVGGSAPSQEEMTSYRTVEEGSSRDRGEGTSSSGGIDSMGSAAMSGTQAQWDKSTRARRKLQRPWTPQKQRSVDLF